MPNHETEGAQARPVWMFMFATAMATTISTLAATAMVKAEASEPTAVTCSCEVPASAAPIVEAPPAQPVPPPQAEQQPEPAEAEQPEPAEQIEQPAVDAPAPKAEVRGSLDKNLIRRIVKAHIGEVRYCYNEGLVHDPELAGRVTVDFVIGVKGKVTRSTAQSDMEGEVPECIANAVARWNFPRPIDGEDVSVTYPFVLEPG